MRLLDSAWVSPLCTTAQKWPLGSNWRPSIIVLLLCISLFSCITILCCLLSNVLKSFICYSIFCQILWVWEYRGLSGSCLFIMTVSGSLLQHNLLPSNLVKIFWNLEIYIIFKKSVNKIYAFIIYTYWKCHHQWIGFFIDSFLCPSKILTQ